MSRILIACVIRCYAVKLFYNNLISAITLYRLDAGWSLKTANMNAWSKQPDPMTAEEHQKILEVIEKAEALERAEQERVG